MQQAPAERRARQADRLTTIRLRLAIYRVLDDRGLASLARLARRSTAGGSRKGSAGPVATARLGVTAPGTGCAAGGLSRALNDNLAKRAISVAYSIPG